MEEADKGFTYEGPDKEISPEMQEAKDRVAAYESNSGLGDPTPYGTKDSIFSDAATLPFMVVLLMINKLKQLWLQILLTKHKASLLNKKKR